MKVYLHSGMQRAEYRAAKQRQCCRSDGRNQKEQSAIVLIDHYLPLFVSVLSYDDIILGAVDLAGNAWATLRIDRPEKLGAG